MTDRSGSNEPAGETSFWDLPADMMLNAMSVLVVPSIALIVGIDVVARYVFASPFFWAQDVNTLLLLLLFFCGQPVCFRHGDHVRMELLYLRFSPFWQRMVDSLSALLAMLIAFAIGWRLYAQMTSPYSAGDTHGFLKMPVMPFRLLILAVMALVVLEAVRRLFVLWRR